MGRAHALAFAREGARVVLCDACRQYNTVPYPLAQPAELASLVSEIEQMGRPVLAAQVDVTDLEGMQELAEQAQHNFGPIDIVVANEEIRFKLSSAASLSRNLVSFLPVTLC